MRELTRPSPETLALSCPPRLVRCTGCLEVERCVVVSGATGVTALCRECLAEAVGVLVGYELDHVEAWLVRAALEANRGNKTRAARALGLHRRSLYRRLSTAKRA